MSETQKEILCELGAENETRVYRAVGGFSLTIRPGPPVPIERGTLVRLKPESRVVLFHGNKVEPVALSTRFKALRPFSFIDIDGCWSEALKDDVIRMDRQEALAALRKGLVIEEKGEENESKSTA